MLLVSKNGNDLTDPSPNTKFAPPENGEPQWLLTGLPTLPSRKMLTPPRAVPHEPPLNTGSSPRNASPLASWSARSAFSPTRMVFETPSLKSSNRSLAAPSVVNQGRIGGVLTPYAMSSCVLVMVESSVGVGKFVNR